MRLLLMAVVVLVAVLLFVAAVVVGFMLLVVGCDDVLVCCDADSLRRGVGCSCVSLRTKITIWRALCDTQLPFFFVRKKEKKHATHTIWGL